MQLDEDAAQSRAVLGISRDIKTELGGFSKKVDDSSSQTDEDHRTYDILRSYSPFTCRLT